MEPNPDAVKDFSHNRAEDTNVCLAIGESEGILPYYSFNDPAVNSFSKAHAALWLKDPNFKLEKISDIKVMPLSKVLDIYLPDGQQIDFLSIDAEGLDLKVLRSNNWEKYRPSIILVEDSLYDFISFSESAVYNYMTSVGYRLWEISGGTLIFERQEK